MKFLKLIPILFIFFGNAPYKNEVQAEIKNPENFRVLSNESKKLSISNVEYFINEGDKYIKMLSGKYNLYGQPEIVNGVDSGSTNWHNDLKEGANLAIMMYFTNANSIEQGGSLSVRNKETNELSCMLHPGKGDMIILNHKETWQHKVGEWKSIPGKEERIVGCFDFNI